MQTKIWNRICFGFFSVLEVLRCDWPLRGNMKLNCCNSCEMNRSSNLGKNLPQEHLKKKYFFSKSYFFFKISQNPLLTDKNFPVKLLKLISIVIQKICGLVTIWMGNVYCDYFLLTNR